MCVFTCCASKDSPRDPWWCAARAGCRTGRGVAVDDVDEGGAAAAR